MKFDERNNQGFGRFVSDLVKLDLQTSVKFTYLLRRLNEI
jgi:hypothetical protein